MAEYNKISIGQNKLEYYQKGKGEPLLFLHGYGTRLSHFNELFKKIQEKKDYEIIAPIMYGINYLKNQPKTIEEYAELTADFCSKLMLGEHKLTGYSIGAATGFILANDASVKKNLKKIVGINPPMPAETKLIRYIKNRAKTLISYHIDTRFYMINSMKKPLTTLKIIKDIKDIDYKKIEKVTQPTLILHAENDEFSKLNKKAKEQLKERFENLEIKVIPGRNHIWLVTEPDLAAREITGFLE